MLSSSSDTVFLPEIATTSLYKPNNWLANINFINHLVLFNDLMIVVMAEQGGGKTSFIQLLQGNLDLEISTCIIDAKLPLAEAQVLIELEKFCNLVPSLKPELSDLVEQVNSIKKHILIIIDNAHHLKENFLKNLLVEVKKYQHNFFHICLATDFSLNPLLNSLHGDTFKNLIHTIELGPLSKKETRKYLLKKLSLNKGINQSLTEKNLSEFYNLTSGYIARINTHLNHFFNLDNKIIRQSFFPRRSHLIAGLFLLIVGAVYLGKNKFSDQVTAVELSNLSRPSLEAQKVTIRNDLKLDNKITTAINKALVSALELVFIENEDKKTEVDALYPPNYETGTIAKAMVIHQVGYLESW
ncbi:AAA family ATPase [Legionella sp. D16C41]|uniref:AAA family ATPase n=1 Tax=Legionella sp. D16C41 TaxID=3402688 RepID=UPI003AF6FBEE